MAQEMASSCERTPTPVMRLRAITLPVNILLYSFTFLGEDCQQFLHIFYEVGVGLSQYAADAVVVESHAGAAGLLHNIENLLAHTQCVEEHGGGSEVHAECTQEEAVRGDTRQFVHHHADDLSAAGSLDARAAFSIQRQRPWLVSCAPRSSRDGP